ncbi:MAG: Amt family ammonium transporter [Saprospiraceae bacterium]|jgi:Amt family ammonium transporter
MYALKKTIGIRVSEKEELMGLDPSEHEMMSYADFMIK